MSITRRVVFAVVVSAAAVLGAGAGQALAAAPAVAIVDDTPTDPATGTGSTSLLPALLQALVSGSASTPTAPAGE